MGAGGGIPLVSAIGGGVIAGQQARERNKAIEKSQQTVGTQFREQQRQIGQRAAIHRLAITRQQHRLIGRIRVAGSQAGTTGGSTLSLIRQADFDAELNRTISDISSRNLVEAARHRFFAQIQSLAGGIVNPTLAGLSGALGGASTGLSIQGAVSSSLNSQNTSDQQLLQQRQIEQQQIQSGSLVG